MKHPIEIDDLGVPHFRKPPGKTRKEMWKTSHSENNLHCHGGMVGFPRHNYVQGGAPPVLSWFISPLTIDVSPINYSYWTYKLILLTMGHRLVNVFFVEGDDDCYGKPNAMVTSPNGRLLGWRLGVLWRGTTKYLLLGGSSHLISRL